MPSPPSKPPDLIWLGRTRQTLAAFPVDVRQEIGFALYAAERGRKHPSAKPLTEDKAFKGAVVLEIVEDHDGNTYRAAYTAKYAGAVYVLHVFQKKSKKGVSTPALDIATIKRRLKEAKAHHDAHYPRAA